METDRIRQFCVIVETGSLSQAAQILGISHSGLSKSISKLEAELRISLFHPRGRGLELTEAGKKLYPQARDLLRQVHEFQSFKLPHQQKLVRIGALEVFINGIIGEISDNAFRILELAPGEIESEILSGNLDFGVTFLPRPTHGIEHLRIGKLSMGVFVKRGAFENTPFSEIPFVVPFAPASGIDPLSFKERDGWPDTLAPRNKRFEVNLMSAAFKLVSRGLCAIFAPVYMAYDHGLVKVRPPAGLPSLDREVWLIKKTEVNESRDSKKIAAIVRKLCIDGAR